MSFLNATWYGGTYKDDLITAIGLTTEQYDALMDGADQTSFGYVVQQANQEIATQYNCIDVSTGLVAINCTAEQLSSLQWGTLGVTKNPKSTWGTDYFPVSNTVAGWGQPDWIPFGVMTHPIEYPQSTDDIEENWTYID